MAEGRAGSCRTLNVFLKYPSWTAKRTSLKCLEDAELRKDIKEHCLRLFSSLLRCLGEDMSQAKSDTSAWLHLQGPFHLPCPHLGAH